MQDSSIELILRGDVRFYRRCSAQSSTSTFIILSITCIGQAIAQPHTTARTRVRELHCHSLQTRSQMVCGAIAVNFQRVRVIASHIVVHITVVSRDRAARRIEARNDERAALELVVYHACTYHRYPKVCA